MEDIIDKIIILIDEVYMINNDNYNAVLDRLDFILSIKNNDINEKQQSKINQILLENNKQINKKVLGQILLLLDTKQKINIKSQLQFLLDMKP